MIEQQGRVVEVLPAQARIEVGPAEGCSRCASGKGCGAGLFVRLINRKPTRLLLDTCEPVVSGQLVTVAIPENLFLRWVMFLYGLPLLAAFMIAIPAQFLANQIALSAGLTDLLVLAASISGFALMLVFLKRRVSAGVSAKNLHILSKQSQLDQAGCPVTN